ncbi:Serine-pyruvate aminotransferase/archaeal aspartate aminotransferase [Gaiella occulta]|uniref:Serine-pyruvate aminotransferase/archaeal aspartate aminotransferase n=1 Tax=Gaiella occulta TaxID=1002870 RepID=A0A7M2YZ49_9ACTN|nr:alanine--glyoxylate aminotransferase family protein [Gaiella occulta]RDI75299.1 Serine-pyruvate aminotransferase/archaeal aspartate aminotransferase [Gaiella occulta]
MPRKRYLLTPGPTPVPPEVLAALGEPVLHHRSPDFKAVFAETRARLRQVFRTENEVLVFSASGTGAFESAVVNLLSPGEKVLAVSHGNFGTRWQKMAAAFGCDVVELTYAWGEAPRPDDVRRALAASGALVALLVHSETSTGVVSDVERLVAACDDAGAISVVDAISSLGAVPLETDAWGVDVVVTGSQKALMTPPGLAFASVSERAWAKVEQATLPRFYWDWTRARANQERNETPFTPATSTIVALNTALEQILAEGLPAVFARHVALGRACRAGARAMGLELYSPDDDSAAVLTGILTPEGIDAVELRLALRDRHGVTIAGGHGDVVDRLFRIGHIGYVDVFDITTALGAIELQLAEMGASVERGAAVAAALEAYASTVAV